MTAAEAKRRLRALANPAIAAHSAGFFKTGPGQYGAGDKFIGVRVPALRKLARECQQLSLPEVEALLDSPIHEQRLLALLTLVLIAARADAAGRKRIYDLYLANTARVNNWDLVDSSAPYLVGAYLFDKSRQPLVRLAKSKNLWQRRIAIVATQHFIRHGDLDDTLKISRLLLADPEELIHKATGWMLREVGKRDEPALKAFLEMHAAAMPRTMLRYAIERLSPQQKQAFMLRKVLRGEM
jgi:3-methyladenine DNA glycosylase AlkD